MSRNEEAWKEVGDRFSSLGKKFRDHYEKIEIEKAKEGTPAAEEAAEGADTVEAGTEEPAPSSDEIKKAFDTISDGLERVFGGLGAAVRDDDVKSESKAAATALVDALGSTIEDLGIEVRKRIKGDHDKPAEEAEEVVEAVESKADETVDDLREDLQDDA